MQIGRLRMQAYNVCNSLCTVDIFLHHAILVDTNRSKNIQSVFVARIDTVEDQAHNNFLPSWATPVPELGFFEVDNITNILHDAMKSTGGELLVFVIVSDSNKHLGVSVVHCWSKIVTILQRELVRIASRSSLLILLVSSPLIRLPDTYTAYV